MIIPPSRAKTTTASALMATALPHVHAAGDETLRLALIGCGGRGTGAAANALAVKNGPIKLVAMADVFQNRLDDSYDALNKEHGAKMDVPPERRFLGFDAYQHAMDACNLAILRFLPRRWPSAGFISPTPFKKG